MTEQTEMTEGDKIEAGLDTVAEAIGRLADAVYRLGMNGGYDANGEPMGGLEQLGGSITEALIRLGNADASTPMGGLEMLGDAIIKTGEKLATAIELGR